MHQGNHLIEREALRQEQRIGRPVLARGQQLKQAAVIGGHQLHCVPVSVGRSGRSVQFGRASAPTIPQPVHTMCGPKAGTGVASGQRSTLSTAPRWQTQQLTDNERTPWARMLPSVIGSGGGGGGGGPTASACGSVDSVQFGF